MTRRTAAILAGVVVIAGCSTGADAGAPAPSSPRPAPTFAAPVPTFAPTSPTATSPSPPTTPPGRGSANHSEGPRPPDEATGGGLLAAIDDLEPGPDTHADTYDRDLFGGAWIDADADACDTRCEVLEAERTTLADGSSGWTSPYDNYQTGDPSELDVDHLVPLAEAWRSGAWAWDPARRIAYANDLDEPATLIAVTAATNRAKSDKDPARWQPSNDAAWCTYVRDWVSTKHTWALTADPAEIDALRNMATARNC